MATIRVRDWTKERIEEIREAESHSSHDSVIKALLKDRELAQFADTTAAEAGTEAEADDAIPGEKPFEDLTVLAELDRADNDIVFLWCPNCGTEIAHVGFDDRPTIAIFEAECQRCLTRLDQHAIVGIEIGYPIEEHIVEGTVEDDLRTCVIDYWDRSLEAVADGSFDGEDVADDRLVYQYNRYRDEFGWEWPEDTPAIGVRPGGTYYDEAGDDRFEVHEAVTDDRGTLDDYRIEYEDGEESVLEAEDLLSLVLGRSLTVEDEPPRTGAADRPTDDD